MAKRLFDFFAAFTGLIVASPILVLFALAVFVQDFRSPFYLAPRAGRGGKPFTMVKLRSMVANADKSGVDSTSSTDMRITRVGHLIRKFKLDELTQLWNVLIGDMSLVGPRPQVQRDVDLYTEVEMGLLAVRPGITDFSSIVFSDEGDILADATENENDPDILYQQLIRPWKSRLGLFYIENRSLWLDMKLIWLTVTAIVSKPAALKSVVAELRRRGADDDMVRVAGRTGELVAHAPPGADEIVTSR